MIPTILSPSDSIKQNMKETLRGKADFNRENVIEFERKNKDTIANLSREANNEICNENIEKLFLLMQIPMNKDINKIIHELFEKVFYDKFVDTQDFFECFVEGCLKASKKRAEMKDQMIDTLIGGFSFSLNLGIELEKFEKGTLTKLFQEANSETRSSSINKLFLLKELMNDNKDLFMKIRNTFGQIFYPVFVNRRRLLQQTGIPKCESEAAKPAKP